MPYIKKIRRNILAPVISQAGTQLKKLETDPPKTVGTDNPDEPPLCAGDLNYLLTAICHEYIRAKGMSYQTFNDIMGVLKGVDAELYRTVIGPYEEVKRIQNGRVSDIEG